ncbi:MAG TPA: FAD-dependent oxidoreductase [Syntrophorhabdaceae bacterium]|nr:FAD-dependent oxidoreductase [Syntrophorhabdaceae bacterium]
MRAQKKLKSAAYICDVAIIGAGGSGLAAAIAAAEKGAKVVVLEKRHGTGGDTALAGGLFAAESPPLKRLKNNSNADELIKRSLSYAHWKTNPRIVRAFIMRSGDTIGWLENMGVNFWEIAEYYPTQGPRIMHLPEGMGAGLIQVLVTRSKSLGVTLLRDTTATEILLDVKGRIVGVGAAGKEGKFRIAAKSVIVAAGGYGGNRELLKKYYPQYTDALHLVGLPHQGDGLRMAIQAGAATEGLGTLLLRGPYFRGSTQVLTVATEPLTIWVNKSGERFIDETMGFNWPEAANALNRQPGRVSFTLFDDAVKREFMTTGPIKGYRNPALKPLEKLDKQLRSEAAKGSVMISDRWDEIARWIGAEPEVLRRTIDEYNRSCHKGYDGLLFKERRFLWPLQTPPYYALRCCQGFLGTIGGIKINHEMEVLNEQDKVIPGLYAVGAGTGGWESDTYCLELSGSAFGFAINSGRIAGENAVEHVSTV